jgi:hypothetical protein
MWANTCKHCYAEAWSKRVGQHVWGVKAKRRFFSENHWLEPVKWNVQAKNRHKRRDSRPGAGYSS